MKLTKTKLKQIIKEELAALKESGGGRPYDPNEPPAGPGGARAITGDERWQDDYEPEEENYEKLAKALHDILRYFLDEAGMENDEAQSELNKTFQRAVEEALEVELGSDMGKIIAQAGL